MSERTLYQFPISHYCEKTRWQMDHKGLEYRAVNLLPGPHRPRTQWMARINTLPILKDGKRAVGDSTRIAYYLEKYYPERALLPTSPDARARVIELEQQFDRLGVHARRWLFGQVIERPEVLEAMLAPYALPRWLKAALTPLTREGVRRLYGLNPKAIMRSQQRLEEGLALLEAQLAKGKGEFLVGDAFSLADIAAASLLGPLLSPEGSPWRFVDENSLSPALQADLAALKARPAGQWILSMYDKHR